MNLRKSVDRYVEFLKHKFATGEQALFSLKDNSNVFEPIGRVCFAILDGARVVLGKFEVIHGTGFWRKKPDRIEGFRACVVDAREIDLERLGLVSDIRTAAFSCKPDREYCEISRGFDSLPPWIAAGTERSMVVLRRQKVDASDSALTFAWGYGMVLDDILQISATATGSYKLKRVLNGFMRFAFVAVDMVAQPNSSEIVVIDKTMSGEPIASGRTNLRNFLPAATVGITRTLTARQITDRVQTGWRVELLEISGTTVDTWGDSVAVAAGQAVWSVICPDDPPLEIGLDGDGHTTLKIWDVQGGIPDTFVKSIHAQSNACNQQNKETGREPPENE